MSKFFISILFLICQYFLFISVFDLFSLKDINVSFLIFAMLGFSNGIYSFKNHTFWSEAEIYVKTFLVFSCIMLLISGLKDAIVSICLTILIIIASLFLSNYIRRRTRGFIGKRVIIFGVNDLALRAKKDITQNKFALYKFLGFVNFREDSDNISVAKNEILEAKEIKNLKIDEIIIVSSAFKDFEIKDIILKYKDYTKSIKFIPRHYSNYNLSSKLDYFNQFITITNYNNAKDKMKLLFKRFFDIIGSLVGLVILLPIYFKFKKEIKSDGGSVLFAHSRVGQNLKPFKMYKFRTMHLDAEKKLEELLSKDELLRKEFYTNFKLKDDPRITKVGKFLRKTSLDEFPQFINVLKGNMSLVGPRPVVQKEIELYYTREVGEKIFQVKPGITGIWQVSGRSDIENYNERVDLDLYYVNNWSLWLDFVIILKTIKNVVCKKGAY